MKNVYLVSTVIILALSTYCMNSKKEEVSVPQVKVEAPLETAAKECCQAIIEKDTITLTADINDINQFKGKLVFLKKDANTYVEGCGEIIEINGKMAFKDKTKIKFDGNLVYNKIDCKE
ncbi:hypothetical protein QO200_13400 [Flavobacterium sp. Arc3]|uniref:hypothetical protein n=1 Tax=Flavobacterium sp. Arc3 TaxID=3046686 RepID=UPI00352E2E21